MVVILSGEKSALRPRVATGLAATFRAAGAGVSGAVSSMPSAIVLKTEEPRSTNRLGVIRGSS